MPCCSPSNGEHAALVKPFIGDVGRLCQRAGIRAPAGGRRARPRRRARRRDSVAAHARRRASSRRSSGASSTATRWRVSMRSASMRTAIAASFTEGPPAHFDARGGDRATSALDARARVPARGTAAASTATARSCRSTRLDAARGARAEALAAAFLTAAGTDDRRAQLPHAVRRDRPRSRATATCWCSSKCACAARDDYGGAAASITARKRARLVAAAERLSRAPRPRAAVPLRCRAARSLDARASSGAQPSSGAAGVVAVRLLESPPQ